MGMDKDYTSLTVVGVDTGCCAHADDIRTCTVGAAKANRQAASLQSLTSEGSLSLNMDKTEILHLAHHLHVLPAEKNEYQQFTGSDYQRSKTSWCVVVSRSLLEIS